jgi:hypothetical protein
MLRKAERDGLETLIAKMLVALRPLAVIEG